MKLPNQTHGPVTLSKIDYAPRMSEETSAFVAVIEINGLKSAVRNDGRGGSNHVHDHAVDQAIEAYAKSLPAQQTEYGPLSFSADYLISTMVDEAIKAADRAKYKKKGFTHYVEQGQKAVYSRGVPTAAMMQGTGIDLTAATIVAL